MVVALMACNYNVAAHKAVPKTETAFSIIKSDVIVAETTISSMFVFTKLENLNAVLISDPIVYRLVTITDAPAAPTDVRIRPVNIAQNRKPPRSITTIFYQPRDSFSC